MNETWSASHRRVVDLVFDPAVQEDGTPMWSTGHLEERVARTDPFDRSHARWHRAPAR